MTVYTHVSLCSTSQYDYRIFCCIYEQLLLQETTQFLATHPRQPLFASNCFNMKVPLPSLPVGGLQPSIASHMTMASSFFTFDLRPMTKWVKILH